MPASLSRVTATVAAALVLAMSGAAAAYAGSWTGSDPAGDVEGSTHVEFPAPCGTDTVVPHPENTSNDITRLRVEHARKRVTLKTVFRDLLGGAQHLTTFEVRTAERRFRVDVERDEDGDVLATLARQPNQAPEPDECGNVIIIAGGVECEGMAEAFKPADDYVSVSIPRRCIKEPRWVKVGVSSIDFSDHTLPQDFWQPAGSDGEPGVFGPYGPKVFRG